MNLENFKVEVKNLNKKFDSTFNTSYFIDGALNEEKYYKSGPYRILWLMKEAYNDPFSYPQFFTTEYEKFFNDLVIGKARATWAPVVYISYSLLNGFKTWEQMNYIKDDPEMAKVLNSVAWVNIQKLPSTTGNVSLKKNIQLASNKYGELLKEQINLLDPHIVICGNTFAFIKHLYDYPKEHSYESDESYVPHYSVENRLFIDPYHPSYAGRGVIDLGMYVDDIVRTIKKYFESTAS